LPRDSDQQQACGEAVEGPPQRGDLVFFPGHVAIATGAHEVVHASQEKGGVVTEPLADLVKRKGEPTAVRRLS
jgi:cell wall-associated NlpC family hydrolase